MSQRRAPSKANVEWWCAIAKAEQPKNYGGAALREWLRDRQNARDKLAEHCLDWDGRLTDWGRANGYKEPK